MAGIGLLLAGIGAWLLYAAITNQAPVKTLTSIIANPANAAAIIQGRQVPLASGTGGTTAPPAGSGAGGGAVVAFARSKIGQPYKFGGRKDGGWDCSGLVMESLRAGLGIKVAHSATAQLLDPRGKTVRREDLKPGDIVFPNLPPIAGDHVQVYAGGGNVIEAPKPGTKVREVPMWGFFTAKRFG